MWPAAPCFNLVGAGGCCAALAGFANTIQLPEEAAHTYSLFLEHTTGTLQCEAGMDSWEKRIGILSLGFQSQLGVELSSWM